MAGENWTIRKANIDAPTITITAQDIVRMARLLDTYKQDSVGLVPEYVTALNKAREISRLATNETGLNLAYAYQDPATLPD